MQSYGPLVLTANTMTQVQVSPSSASVYIGNDSPFDVLVSFSESQPAVVTSASGTSDWTGVVQAFHHVTLPTPGNISSPQGQVFAGNVWLLPLNTRNANLAQNGTVSSTANLWVIACQPGETPPDAYASPRQTDITSQARVIAVPIVPQTAVISIANLASGMQAEPVSGTILAQPQAGWGPVLCYLYGFIAQMNTATQTWAQLECGFAECDNTGTPFNNHPILRFYLTGNTGATPPAIPPFVYTPAWPLDVKFTPANTALTVQFYLRVSSSQGSSPVTFTATAQIGGDPWNGLAVPQIGGGQNRTIQLVGPGVIF